MIWSVVTSMALAVAYVAAATIAKRKLPESISAMVYVLPMDGQWAWTVWLWIVSATACIPLIEVMEDSPWQFLAFLALGCLVFCGAMPLVRKDKNTAHYALSITAGVLSQVCVALTCPWWLMAWMGYFPLCRLGVDKVLASETVCSVAVYGALLTGLIQI